LSCEAKVLRDTLLIYLLPQHLCIDVYRAINAFINYADVPGGPTVFYGKINHPTQVAKMAVYSAQALLADSFFVSSGLSAFLIFSVF
jgi:hypothetical protein